MNLAAKLSLTAVGVVTIIGISGCMPRDATVIAILPRVTPEIAISLGMLRRRGLAVVAIINVFDQQEYADAAGPLLAEQIETRHLHSEESVVEICAQYWLR